MPKSDTWPGGTGMETMTSMDSAGSCDSVVSGNSGCSDDSLDYLSAEEKACIMFLEETIESLDAEEDSGLSNDEPDQLPNFGNLQTKLADLSASMSKSKFNSSEKPASREQIKKNVDTHPMQSYLVPTPLIVASSSLGSGTCTKPVSPTGMSQFMPKNYRSAHKHNEKPPPIPSEVNVAVPASTKPKDPSFRTAEVPLLRGPLSYDALNHLRRNASTKKTPLCPSVDHTIEFDKRHSAAVKDPNFGNFQRSEKFQSEVSKSKTEPPVVPPKPTKIPVNIPGKTQIEGNAASHFSNSVKHSTDPKVVRLEALQKLGLLKDEEPEDGVVGPPPPPPKSYPSLDPTSKRFARDPFRCNPSRSPSCYFSQGPTEPKSKVLHTSASFQYHTRHDQQPLSESLPPAQSSVLKRAGLERSTSLDYHAINGNAPEPQRSFLAKPVKTTTTDKPASEKPSNSVGYTVMVVPGMGADRKEALRKLGLLKN
ncbi:specifically androgen-regulated gene protein [Cololabis saira]|uniref:specifically androgen-regulated gene protein n=1 Tax=Cololabis saira TaxID=129043 RepID=UPI002AD2D25F|nr:specifically androgen-regulated gene protein [Cololabis saira]